MSVSIGHPVSNDGILLVSLSVSFSSGYVLTWIFAFSPKGQVHIAVANDDLGG